MKGAAALENVHAQLPIEVVRALDPQGRGGSLVLGGFRAEQENRAIACLGAAL